MKMNKILIGVPTYPGQEYCLEEFMRHLKAINYDHFDVLFVVDKNEEKYQRKIQKMGFECARVSEEKSFRCANITYCRRLLRKKMLEENYDYLLFIDSDVMVQPDIIKKLIQHKKTICSGIFMSTFPLPDGRKVVAPVLYDFAPGGKLRLMQKKEILDDSLKKVAVCGFGCCLLRRDVLEKVDFRWYEQSKSGEDVAFCHDAAQIGFEAFVDCSVRTWHLSYPPGDSRNEKFKIV